jgi:hypothetical protein
LEEKFKQFIFKMRNSIWGGHQDGIDTVLAYQSQEAIDNVVQIVANAKLPGYRYERLLGKEGMAGLINRANVDFVSSLVEQTQIAFPDESPKQLLDRLKTLSGDCCKVLSPVVAKEVDIRLKALEEKAE